MTLTPELRDLLDDIRPAARRAVALQARRRRRITLTAAIVAAIAAAGSAVAAVTLLGQAAPARVQRDIHRNAVGLFAGHPGLIAATARVVADAPDATLYGISDREGNYCIELVGATRGFVWSFSCDLGQWVGGRYATAGATADPVYSIVVDGIEPPVVWWGRLTSGTSAARAVYPDGTTEQIPIGRNGFFVYEPSARLQQLARRVPMTIEFLSGAGTRALSTTVLPPQPLTVSGPPRHEKVSARVIIDGAAAIAIEGKVLGHAERYIPLGPDGSFTITRHPGSRAPLLLQVVDKQRRPLSDYLDPVPPSFWRPLLNEARG